MSSSSLVSEVTDVAAPSETAALIRRVLEQAPGPVGLSHLLKELPKAVRPPQAEAERVLDEEMAAGRLWRFPDLRGKAQYWIHSPTEFARVCLARKLQGPPQTRAEALKSITTPKAFSGLTKAVREQLLNDMLQRGEVHEWPPFVGGKKTKARPISGIRPDPADYLQDAVQKVAATLGLSNEEILKAAVTWAERELRELKLEQAEAASLPSAVTQDERLLEAMRTVNHRTDDGDMVLIADLRKELDAHMPGADFDAAVLDAVRRRRFAIHRFDSPNLITDEARSQMIRDDAGNCYNTISLWRN